jgi:hypothetical protein
MKIIIENHNVEADTEPSPPVLSLSSTKALAITFQQYTSLQKGKRLSGLSGYGTAMSATLEIL